MTFPVRESIISFLQKWDWKNGFTRGILEAKRVADSNETRKIANGMIP